MASGYPDWTKAVTLIGQDSDGNLVIVRVDADGQLTIPLKGENPDGDLANVAVDADGQLYAIMRGASGVDLTVDINGWLGAVVKGMDSSSNIVNVAVDDTGQMIMVPRGQSGNYMAIDAEGFMTAVLKGLYGDELRTIGLDDDGRISGYLVDDIDLWGQILRVGNAEQAARLGSPVTWDRRGQTQLVLDFSEGLQGVRQTTSGAGASVSLSPEWTQRGGYSAKLVGGSDASLYASIQSYVGIPPTGRWGGMISWSAEATPAYLETRLGGIVDHQAYHGYIRYDFANTKLQYRDSSYNWQDIAVKDLEPNEFIFHKMKIVIDVDSATYVRVLLNNTQYDLTAALLTSAAPTIGDYMYFQTLCFSNSGDNDVVYVDSMILKVLEP